MPSFGFSIIFIQRVFPKSRVGLAAFHSSKLEVFLSKPLVLFHGLAKHSIRGSKALGGWFQLAQGKISQFHVQVLVALWSKFIGSLLLELLEASVTCLFWLPKEIVLLLPEADSYPNYPWVIFILSKIILFVKKTPSSYVQGIWTEKCPGWLL